MKSKVEEAIESITKVFDDSNTKAREAIFKLGKEAIDNYGSCVRDGSPSKVPTCNGGLMMDIVKLVQNSAIINSDMISDQQKISFHTLSTMVHSNTKWLEKNAGAIKDLKYLPRR